MDNNQFIEPITLQGQTAQPLSRQSSGIDAEPITSINVSGGIVQGTSRLLGGTTSDYHAQRAGLTGPRLGGPLSDVRWDACYCCRLWLCCSCIHKCIYGGQSRLSHFQGMDSAGVNQNTSALNTWRGSSTSSIKSPPFGGDLIRSGNQQENLQQWQRPPPPYTPGETYQNHNLTRMPQQHIFESYRTRPYYNSNEARGETQGRENRFKRWLITRNGPEEDLFSLGDRLRAVAQSPVIKYIVTALEPNSTGKLHMHCYLHLKDRFSPGNLQTMWEFLKGCNFRSIGDANSWEAEEYVKKKGDWWEEGEPYRPPTNAAQGETRGPKKQSLKEEITMLVQKLANNEWSVEKCMKHNVKLWMEKGGCHY